MQKPLSVGRSRTVAMTKLHACRHQVDEDGNTQYEEAVIPHLPGIEWKDRAGRRIATGKAATDPANKKLLVVPVKAPLAPGDYKVAWHAVSDDTHRVKGNYSFSVTPQ